MHPQQAIKWFIQYYFECLIMPWLQALIQWRWFIGFSGHYWKYFEQLLISSIWNSSTSAFNIDFNWINGSEEKIYFNSIIKVYEIVLKMSLLFDGGFCLNKIDIWKWMLLFDTDSVPIEKMIGNMFNNSMVRFNKSYYPIKNNLNKPAIDF